MPSASKWLRLAYARSLPPPCPLPFSRPSLTLLPFDSAQALGFFKANGFSPTISLGQDDYVGRIGEYEKSVLVECVLYPEVPYARLPLMIRCARSALLAAERQLPNQVLVHTPNDPSYLTSAVTTSAVASRPASPATSLRLLPPGFRPLRIGKHLHDAIAALGRELSDPSDIATDYGSGFGRLAPVRTPRAGTAHAASRAASGGDMASVVESSEVRAATVLENLRSGLCTLISSKLTSHLNARRLVAILDRVECAHYAEETECALADLHRYSLAPMVAEDGNPIRSVLQPIVQVDV